MVDEITDGAPVCATCVGRAHGAGVSTGVLSVIHSGGLLFSPRGTITRPATCPASGFTALDERMMRGRCNACGFEGRIKGGSRGYSWSPLRIEAHESVELVAPCPFHLWDRISGEGTCRCGHEPWEVTA